MPPPASVHHDQSLVFAIDFDGTICEFAVPEIGAPLPGAFETLRELQALGHRLVLWTCREDEPHRAALQEAIAFCEERGVYFECVNCTPEDYEFRRPPTLSRKVKADFYIDDRMLGGFPGWEVLRELLKLPPLATKSATPGGK